MAGLQLGSGSSQANPISFESRALQCECCARTPIAAGGDDMVTTSGEGCPGDNLHQKVAAGPGAGARLPPQPTVFRNQVFFEDDPSSSTSLRPHPARGRVRWRVGRLTLAAMLGDPSITQPRPSGERSANKSGDDTVAVVTVWWGPGARAGPGAGAHQPWHCDTAGARSWSSPSSVASSFFRNQVFFDNDPSSSTSLLSSVGITTRSYLLRRPEVEILCWGPVLELAQHDPRKRHGDRAVGWRVATSGTGTGDADTSHRSGLGGAGAGPGAGARQHPHTRHSTGEGEARAVPAPVRGRRGHNPHHTPHTSSGWGKPNTLSGEISAFVCYSSSLRDNRRIHGGIFFNMPHAQINLLIFTLKELFSQFDWKC